MKKMTREKVIELLKNKNRTYRELAIITGYHEKSLIRLNSLIKNNDFKIDEKARDCYGEIIEDYMKGDFKDYRDFYDKRKSKYAYKYSTICKILKTAPIKIEMMLIKKIKTRGDYHFAVYDSSNGLMVEMKSLKNDCKTMKKMLFKILTTVGTPPKICFINFFKTVPLEINRILDKYDIEIVPFKTIYKNILNSHPKSFDVRYKKNAITKEDFYDFIPRKCIKDNCIQFRNVRYEIESGSRFYKNTEVLLYYDDETEDMFISHKKHHYRLKPYRITNPKLGNTKY